MTKYRSFDDYSKYKAVRELLLEAVEYISTHRIVFRTYDEHGNSADVVKKPTKAQAKILEQIMYSAVSAVMHHAPSFALDSKSASTTIQAIKDTAEFCAINMIDSINAYDSVYIPLWMLFEYYFVEEPHETVVQRLRNYGLKNI